MPMIQRLSATDALASLRSSPDGLGSAEAARRLGEFGPNVVEDIRRRPLLARFVGQLTHFFAIILWLAAGLALVAQHEDPQSGMGMIAAAIIGVIVVNGAFAFVQEFRAERAITALQRMLPRRVFALRDGTPVWLPASEVVPGDVLQLEAGDVVPADCRILSANAVRVNAAVLTGESAVLDRTVEAVATEDVRHAPNVLLAGCALVTGKARGVVFATGMHSEFGKIARLTQQAPVTLTPLQQEIARLSRIVAVLATALGVGFLVVGFLLGTPLWGSILFSVGVIVANVPEGLLPTVTLALAVGAQRMARRHALVRRLPAVETLGAASVICTDKTGTLTENRMRVRRLYVAGETQPWPDHGAPLGVAARRIFEGAWLCQDLKRLGGGAAGRVGDPMELALRDAAESAFPEPAAELVDEIGFDSERKRLATLYRTSEGPVLYVKGALEPLLPLCERIADGGGERALRPDDARDLLAAQQRLADEGYRVLAFAYRPVAEPCGRDALERHLVLAGLVGLEDPPRPEVPDAIRRCRDAGIRVIMVTGDHPSTAVAIGRQIGLLHSDAPRIVRGEALRRLSTSQLQLALDAPEIVFARVDPDQKLRIVSALQQKGEIVAVTGDGVNDAPALRHADIGIAMGRTGTEVAREAADIVLADDNFASIVAAVEEGRAVFANTRKFLAYILTSNVPELVPFLAFVLFRVPLALTIVQILAVDLGTDMLPALALGAEAPEPGVMHRPPRRRGEHLLTPGLLARAYLFLGLFEAAAAMLVFARARDDGLGYVASTTACLATVVVMQVANVFLCRSEDRSIVEGLASNRLVFAGIATELALIAAIAYTSLGNRLFGTAPLPGRAWLWMLPFAFAMVLAEELRKLARRAVFSRRVRAPVPEPRPGIP